MRIRKLLLSVACVIFALMCVRVEGQVKNLTPVERRAQDVSALIRANPGDYEKYFSTSFLAQVPPERLTPIFVYYYTNLGRVLKVETKTLESPLAGQFNFIFEKNASVPVNIAVDAAEPHLITGLLLGNPVSLSGSLDALAGEFKALPGESSLLIARLAGDKLEPLVAHNAERPLAVGSAFKLYVLAELLRSVNKGERRWTDVVALRPEAVSLPSGILHRWPVGSALTLQTLAALMISQSDNTATDQLLLHLGREQVERAQALAGHSKPELNMPFLSTLEMFRLKGERGGASARKYLALGVQERRAFLTGALTQVDKGAIAFAGEPAYADSIEWFASASDMSRAMNWLRLSSEAEPGRQAGEILAINPGLAVSKEKWKYVGYKGGSEPGVMNMTYLLQSSKGDWYALSASWNNTKAPIDESKLASLVGRAIELMP
ncbi:MAG TPA: serine hydrolase [Pyrinomonadaceae bacterium]